VSVDRLRLTPKEREALGRAVQELRLLAETDWARYHGVHMKAEDALVKILAADTGRRS
jgi:hypothetical protein